MQAHFKRRAGEANAVICAACVVFTALEWWAHSVHGSSAPNISVLQCTADNVYGGKPWGLVTAIFFHAGALHIFMNLSFLWRVGNAVEEKIGSARYVAFILISGAVGNALELSFRGPPIGISGSICAVFGFMWQSRSYYEDFYIEANDKAVKFLLTALVVMIGLDYVIEDFRIAHYAHFAGLGFGMAVARATIPRYSSRERMSSWISLMILIGLAVMSVVYAPWSKTWLTEKSRQAIADGNIVRAEQLITKASWLDDSDPYILYLQALIKFQKGEFDEGLRIFKRLDELEPWYSERLRPLINEIDKANDKAEDDPPDDSTGTPRTSE